MNAIPLVRATIILKFTHFLDRAGVPTDRWLERANLSPALLGHPEQLVPIVFCSEFVEQVARAEGLDTLGILVGQKTYTGDLGAYGHLLSQSLTLYDLLTTLERTINLLHSGERVQLVWQPDALWLQSHLYAIASYDYPQAQVFSFFTYLNVLRMALGSQWKPPAVQLAVKPNKILYALEDFEGVSIQFGTPSNGIKIPKALLSQPIYTSYLTKPKTSQKLEDHLQTSAPAQDLSGSLQQFIESFLPQGQPGISLAAEATGLSVRSFQRRLTEAGINYSQLVEKVRCNLAMRWLREPSLKLTDIAAELGYTDAANFTRAFKRWTGMSPREFRLTNLTDHLENP